MVPKRVKRRRCHKPQLLKTFRTYKHLDRFFLRLCNSLQHVQSVFLRPYHMWYRHGLWGHGCRAPLCCRHGLVLPVLATGQLLLSRLVPLHLWPVEEKQTELTVRTFSSSPVLPETNLILQHHNRHSNTEGIFIFFKL